ncbi:gyf domain containing protein [Niveomyces insectorum RCEF 264]|uniref:Gyf domain containing protein n=1 Tax=Niveomyces insectorum RCEF 264 TaxID=1081102 RepID=A0A167XMY2_9HYPO|nr:gyf domain containing protein [Niveomyces insectorum RCEF 264]
MSSNTPASFASAAAGQSRSQRGDGDWSRREGRPANGTMTFRRTSTAPSSQQSQAASDATTSATAPSASEPQSALPDLPPFDGSLRYSREQLLGIYKATPVESIDVANLFVSGWNPSQANGATRGWGKSSEGTVPQDPTVCWDSNGRAKLMGLQEMTAEEKETFTDVNSTLKPQQQKDGGQPGGGSGAGGSGVNGRKTSVSHGSGYNNTPSSLSASRPTMRRRETSEPTPFSAGGGSGGGGGGGGGGSGSLASPLANRTPRDESSWFGRKGADTKETQQQQFEEPEEEPSLTAAKPGNLGSVGRSNTAGSGLGSASALWGSSGPASTSAAGAAATGAAVGAFGSFALPTNVGDKRFGSTRGESRLAHLIPKQDASEPAGSSAKPPSVGPTGSSGGGANTKESWRLRPRTDTDPFAADDGGSTAVSAFAGSSHQQNPGSGRNDQHPLDTPMKKPSGDFGLSDLNIGSSADDNATGSPETNPFRSPPAERGVGGGGGGDDQHPPNTAPPTGFDKGLSTIGGSGSDHVANFGSIRGGYPVNAFDGSDRSQTSSVGAKGFSGLGNIAGWGNSLNASTPDRERTVFASAFGSSLFSPVTGDLQSPGFGGVPGAAGGGSGMFGGPPSAGGPIGGTGSIRASGSKLGSLFPASMQAQMAGNQEPDNGGLSDSIPDLRQTNPLGAIGRETLGSQLRESDFGVPRPGRGIFDEFLEANRPAAGGVFTSEQQSQSALLASAPSPLSQLPPFDSGPLSSIDTPPNAPRTMVMPDRMRWVYLDPQGQTQGPFTGLEMNDWYKANFFTPDLRVKKVEDVEFEPLGQLIRRIGNSREPFLVPQMGVAHGQPSLSGTFAHGDRGSVIPPLVGAFPSYGRTLTAEEQNNLERRKQEEQYMLARQRELMTVPPHHPFPGGRVPAAPGAPGGALHHHSSAHSLQSQPSFGSMTSPLAAAPPPMSGPLGTASGFFDHAGLPATTQPPISASSEFLREEFSLQERQMLLGVQHPASGLPGAFPPSSLADPTSLGHLPATDQLQRDSQGFSERLKEFKQLREQLEAEEAGSFRTEPGTSTAAAAAPAIGSQITHGRHQQAAAADIMDEVASERQIRNARNAASGNETLSSSMAALSLTQQVQKTQEAAAAAQHQHRTVQTDGPVIEAAQTDLPMPFPPPQGSQPGTTLAAPTAQRTRSTLPDQYAASRSQSETPESAAAGSSVAQPPALAPWAREPGVENHRGPSLKEIQEAEAKKAAKAEEAAAAARKAAAEQEAALLREREKAAATLAPGLPTSSTWANGLPAAAVPISPWAKASVPKSTQSSAAAAAAERKKTLADIQREEEARKQKIRDAAPQTSAAPVQGAGKRYADLASRTHPSVGPSPVPTSASPVAAGSSGWATVGAGGKVKVPPTGPSVSRPATVTAPTTRAAVAPQASIRSVSKQLSGVVGKADGGLAMEEFNKWLHRELSRGIADDIDVNMFVDTLLQLPTDQTIISEAVYANSKTMDGRHFADEFIRRKKLAEKGVIEKQAAASSTDNKSGGGWSEVAKKGGNSTGHQKEESMPAGFKVVPSRKKGKK